MSTHFISSDLCSNAEYHFLTLTIGLFDSYTRGVRELQDLHFLCSCNESEIRKCYCALHSAYYCSHLRWIIGLNFDKYSERTITTTFVCDHFFEALRVKNCFL